MLVINKHGNTPRNKLGHDQNFTYVHGDTRSHAVSPRLSLPTLANNSTDLQGPCLGVWGLHGPHTHTNMNIISHTKNTCGKSCYPTTSIERVSLLRKHLSTRRISSDDTCTNYRTTSDTTSASPRHLQNKSNASGLDIWVGQILVINVIVEFNIHKVRVYTLYTTSTTKLIF